MKNEGVATIYQLGSEKLTETLNKAGYNDIFNIVSESLTEFTEKNNTIPESDIKQIYKSAKDRVENLQMLVMAWQLHNDPITKNIKKLDADTGLKDLQEALERSLGSGADFNDLFPERSTQGYAEATSIQSLFSPGRYLTVLYKIAKQLLPTDSDRAIDSRRPDLKSLILSTTNMNKEVSSLDILLDVLQADITDKRVSLKDVYHPLTLPYDDDLVQVRAATEAQGTSLINIWDVLLDTEKKAFDSTVIEPTFTLNKEDIGIYSIKASSKPNPVTRERLGLTPNSFNLLVKQDTTVQELANHFNISCNTAEDLARQLNLRDTFFRSTGIKLNKLLELTGQDIYSNTNIQNRSRYIKLGSSQNVPVTEYGANFLNSNETTPLWVNIDQPFSNFTGDNTVNLVSNENSEQPLLNFTESNVVNIGSRLEKLIRLSNSTGLTFEQLDWIIVNASGAISEHGGEVVLNSSVLTAIAEFIRLKDKYHISLDKYVTFFGKANLYAEVGKDSFYKSTFSTLDDSETIPIGATIRFAVSEQGLYESICCGALSVTADEFLRIGKYCFGDNVESVTVSEDNIAQLYRLGKIPNMLGLSFTEAEKLWKLMKGGEDDFLRQIGQNPNNLKVLDIIKKTEVLLNWMNNSKLDVYALQAMVTDKFSGTATPELYNFLSHIYKSLKSTEATTTSYNKEVKCLENLYRIISTDFNLKHNVMIQVINWVEKTNIQFTLQKYWEKIDEFFSIDHEEPLAALEETDDLVNWSQQISQYVLIAQWAGLSEQDLLLLVNHPEQLISKQYNVPKPSLYLLLVLSRLKEWQQRVKVPADEAMRYFSQANADNITEQKAIQLLAHIHGWNETSTSSINKSLYDYSNENKINISTSAIEVNATNIRDDSFSGRMAIDGDLTTRWATTDDTRSATLELTFKHEVNINKTRVVQCYINPNVLFAGYSIDYWNGKAWVVAGSENDFPISWVPGVENGVESVIEFDTITSNKIRINTMFSIRPSVYEFELFYIRKNFPVSFEQVFTMERWVSLGNQFKIGSRTLGDLVTMAEEDRMAEDSDLIASTAQSLMAAVKGE